MTKPMPDTEKPLIITFLQRLNIARRHLSIYPPEHPAIRESIGKTLTLLQDFFLSAATVTIGIAPAAMYYEQIKFDNEDQAVADFCHFFSGLGVATVSFLPGISADELIRFIHLLRSDRNQIEAFGGFPLLLEEQRIQHIQVIAVDYEAFQAKALGSAPPSSSPDLWENFLFGLNRGILDFDVEDEQNLTNFAQMLNSAHTNATIPDRNYQHKLSEFIDNSLYYNHSQALQKQAGTRLNHLLQQLSNEAREFFLSNILQSLNKNPEPAENILSEISPHFFDDSLVSLSRAKNHISTRLVNLLELFSTNTQKSPGKGHDSNNFAPDVMKARLDELFREEQQEAYLPNQYQTALADIFTDKIAADLIPDEVQTELRQLIEHQAVEQHLSPIILKLLESPLTRDVESAIQEQLLELTKFYLDTGHFRMLKNIFLSWHQHLNSGFAHLDIFADKVIATHSQKSFITEILDGFDIWEHHKHADLIAYIETVGEPYIAPIIERLGAAPNKADRLMWLQILKKISANTQQAIIEALADDRWYLVRNLLSVLGGTPNPQTLKASLPFCNHDHPMVRIEAISNLLMSNPATGNRYLIQELQNTDPVAKDAALRVAALSKDPAVIQFLHTVVQTQAASEEELQQQITAIQSLGHIAAPETLVIFRRLLMKKGLFISSKMKSLHQEMLKALPNFSGPVAEKLISELHNSKHKTQLLTVFSNAKGATHEIH